MAITPIKSDVMENVTIDFDGKDHLGWCWWNTVAFAVAEVVVIIIAIAAAINDIAAFIHFLWLIAQSRAVVHFWWWYDADSIKLIKIIIISSQIVKAGKQNCHCSHFFSQLQANLCSAAIWVNIICLVISLATHHSGPLDTIVFTVTLADISLSSICFSSDNDIDDDRFLSQIATYR